MHDLTRNLLAALRSEARTRSRTGPVRRLALATLDTDRAAWEAAECPDGDQLPPPKSMHPVARVTVEITLRAFDENLGGRQLPADLTDEALADCARRLVVDGQDDGRLITTTLWREPTDHDTDAIENVGGSLRVVGVEVRR